MVKQITKSQKVTRDSISVKMTGAYPQMKDIAFPNVKKLNVVIVDNTCDPKILPVSLYL